MKHVRKKSQKTAAFYIQELQPHRKLRDDFSLNPHVWGQRRQHNETPSRTNRPVLEYLSVCVVFKNPKVGRREERNFKG